MGGIIAFLVARDQIKKQQNQNLRETLAMELPVLTGLELECSKVLKQLKTVETNYEMFKGKEATYIVSLDALIWSRWEKIHYINDPVLQEELILHREALERNIEVFDININPLIEQLKQKRRQARKMNPLDNGFDQLELEISKENNYLEAIKNDKVQYLKELPFCIEKTQKILNNISIRKTKIHDILKKSNYYNKELLSNPQEFKVDR
ncbi:hypothetical protein SAMN05518683_11769 [Salibacterium halotolerans]|uniref:Uncharacterized protein n=1 Tax=Salibacterium halotolerans TaxID=1884432 RepID=A0A1I5VVJ9_9BACI|nr:hypothetical protein SAMN05518683_11769 [Salibacterium halotolerans]